MTPHGECGAALGILRPAGRARQPDGQFRSRDWPAGVSRNKTATRAVWSIPYYKDFAPRIGLAWRAADRTTLRGGYGIFYTPDVINTYRQLAFQNRSEPSAA